MKKIVLATRNEGKIEEIRPHLASLGYEVFGLEDFDVAVIEETGSTLKDNAIIKARHTQRVTNFMVLSDDSGLEVEALDGKPGVLSARFSTEGTDEANNRFLLRKMADKTNRSARFKTVMVLRDEEGYEHVFEGVLNGYIHTAMEGSEGFGYDPLFIPVGHTETLASLGLSVKNRISHRKKCLNKVIEFLKNSD